MSITCVGSVTMLVIAVAVKLGKLGGFWKNKRVVFERNWLDHVDGQQVMKRLLVEHFFFHLFGDCFPQVFVGFKGTQQILARNLYTLIIS